jgi:hypothetical protein
MDPIIDWQISRHDIRSRGTYLLETGEENRSFFVFVYNSAIDFFANSIGNIFGGCGNRRIFVLGGLEYALKSRNIDARINNDGDEMNCGSSTRKRARNLHFSFRGTRKLFLGPLVRELQAEIPGVHS